MEMFCTLITSMSISWLWDCIIVLQDIINGTQNFSALFLTTSCDPTIIFTKKKKIALNDYVRLEYFWVIFYTWNSMIWGV